MTETLSRTAPAARRTTRPTWLGRRPRKAVLVLHIASSGVWLGLDAVMAVLVVTSAVTDDVRTRAVCYQALKLVTVWPMTVTGLICLVTGVVLGLGTTYGLVRYWWVLLKLAINVLLCTLVLVALRPGIDEVAERGSRLLDGEAVVTAVGDLAFPPIVSPTLLMIAVVLSVFKPWGRVRRSRSSRPEPARPAS
jgi:uncharacterized membrane protein